MTITWVDDIKTALRELGGEIHRGDIIAEVRRIRARAGRSLPSTLEQTVQQALQRHCCKSNGFKGIERFVLLTKGSRLYRLA